MLLKLGICAKVSEGMFQEACWGQMKLHTSTCPIRVYNKERRVCHAYGVVWHRAREWPFRHFRIFPLIHPSIPMVEDDQFSLFYWASVATFDCRKPQYHLVVLCIAFVYYGSSNKRICTCWCTACTVVVQIFTQQGPSVPTLSHVLSNKVENASG